jgi:putative transposase
VHPSPFDEVFRSEDINVVRTPFRTPRANTFAERWVRTARAECLDWTLIQGRRQLERVLRTYTTHYNRARPIVASTSPRPSEQMQFCTTEVPV